MKLLSFLLVIAATASIHTKKRSSHRLHHAEKSQGKLFGQCKAKYDSRLKQEATFHKSHTDGVTTLTCDAGINIVAATATAVTSTCCPADNLMCGGCSVYSGGDCEVCQGGYIKTATRCSRCEDTYEFVDIEGLSCKDYETQGLCRNGAILEPGQTNNYAKTLFNLTSAAEACCVCGGGNNYATPFTYRSLANGRIVKLGDDFSFPPYPKTGIRYGIDESCTFSEYGITVDGTTGVIASTTTTKAFAKEFSATCKIIAYENEAGDVSGSTKVTITAKPSIVTPIDSNFGTRVLVYDSQNTDKTYKVTGGTISEATISCTPGPMLQMDDTGVISLASVYLSNYNSMFTELGGVKKKSASEDMSHVFIGELKQAQSMCTASYKLDGKAATTSLMVIGVPSTLPVLSYSKTTANIIPGRPMLPGLKANIEFSKDAFPLHPACSIGDQLLDYNHFTGYVSWKGLRVVHINGTTGDVGGIPARDLLHRLLYPSGQQSMDITCQMYTKGYYPGMFYETTSDTIVVKKGPAITLKLRDTSCWVPIADYQTEQIGGRQWVATKGQLFKSGTGCKASCALNVSCAGFIESEGCYEIAFSPVSTNPTAISSGTVRVPNCMRYKTCINLNVASQYWMSGRYCPLFPDKDSTTVPLLVNEGKNAETSYYLRGYDQNVADNNGLGQSCANANYLLQAKITEQGICEDSHWKDDESNNCAAYVTNDWCKDGRILEETKIGKGANVHCCACGKEPIYPKDSVQPDNDKTEIHGKILGCITTNDLTLTHHRHGEEISLDTHQEATVVLAPGVDARMHARHHRSNTAPTQEEAGLSPITQSCPNPFTFMDTKLGRKMSYTGLVEVGNEEVPKPEDTFTMGDPNTDLRKDYHLHPCDCFGENWGKSYPVTDSAFRIANSGSTFNKLNPPKVQLFKGQYMCAPGNENFYNASRVNATNLEENAYGTVYTEIYFDDDRNMKLQSVWNTDTSPDTNDVFYMDEGDYITKVIVNRDSVSLTVLKTVITTHSGKQITKTWPEYNSDNNKILLSSAKVTTSSTKFHFTDSTLITIGVSSYGDASRLPQTQIKDTTYTNNEVYARRSSSSGSYKMIGTRAFTAAQLRIVEITGTETAKCSCGANEKVIGGACMNKEDEYWDFGIIESYPDSDTSWQCSSDSDGRHVKAQCVCAQIPDLTTISRVSASTAYLSSSATCPSGTTIIMGGCDGDRWSYMIESKVDKALNSWKCGITTEKTVTAYAICLKDEASQTLMPSAGKQLTGYTANDLATIDTTEEATPAPVEKPSGTYLLNSFLLDPANGVTCEDKCRNEASCKFFAVVDKEKHIKCELYSHCSRLVKYHPFEESVTVYAITRSTEEPLCHIADPEKCWARTMRRESLTGRKVINTAATMKWLALVEQCETIRLLGGAIESCAPPSYYKWSEMSSHMSRIPVPGAFPHGAQIRTACMEDRYSLIKRSWTQNEASIMTCIDGEWRDNRGHIGMTTHTCASCVQVSQGTRNGLYEMAQSNYESVYFLEQAQFTVVPFSVSEIISPDMDINVRGNSLALRYMNKTDETERCLDFAQGKFELCDNVLDNSQLTSFVDVYPVFLKNVMFTKEEDVSVLTKDVAGVVTAHDHNENSPCPLGVYSNGACFQLHETSKTRADAATACRDLGGYLAGIHSEDQFKAVGDLLDTDKSYWIGYSRTEAARTKSPADNDWVWEDTVISTFKSWNANEPNDYDSNEDCVQVTPGGNWNDIECSNSLPYVCATPPGDIVMSCVRSWISTFSSDESSEFQKCIGLRDFNWNTVPETKMVSGSSELACPEGMAMSKIRLSIRSDSLYHEDKWKIAAQCHYAPALAFEMSVTIEIKGSDRLFQSKGGCPIGFVLTKISIQSEEKAMLNCRQLSSGMSIDIARTEITEAPKVMKHGPADANSGLYCPTAYDDTGRLKFSQVQTYKAGANLVDDDLAYDKTTGKWCIGSACAVDKGAIHPLDLKYAPGVVGLHAVALKDLPGTALEAPQAPGAPKIELPPYPKLVSFTPSKPKYNKVCFQDGKRTRVEDMMDAGVTPDDPCYNVAANAPDSKNSFTEDPGSGTDVNAQTPGVTYNMPFDCLGREANRASEDAWNDVQNAAVEITFGTVQDIGNQICNFIPKPAVGFSWGGEVTAELDVGDICGASVDLLTQLPSRVAEMANSVQTYRRSVRDGNDCNSAMAAYSRIVCDVNCALDAVVAGTQATTDNLQMVYDGLDANNKALSDYWGEVLSIKIDALNNAGHHHRSGAKGALDELESIVDDFVTSESVDKLMTSARSGSPHVEGAKIFHRAHDQIDGEWKDLKEKIEAAKGSTDVNAKTMMSLIKTASSRIKKHVSAAHHRLNAAMGTQSNIDDMWLRDQAEILMDGVMSKSLEMNSDQLTNQKMYMNLQQERSTRLSNAAESMVGSKQATKLGTLNFKLDKVSSQIEELSANIEGRSLQSLIENLNEVSSVLLSDVGSYHAVTKALHNHHRSALESLEEYFNCGTDDSTIRDQYKQAHRLRRRAADTLISTIPRVEDSLRKAHGLFVGHSLLTKVTEFAVRGSLLGHHRGHANQWLSQAGVDKVYGKIAESFERTPRETSDQLNSIFKTASILVGADTFTLPRNESFVQDHAARVIPMIEQLRTHHHSFANTLSKDKHAASMVTKALKHALPEIAYVPPTCAELAFSQHAEARTADLVLLGEVNGQYSSFLEKSALNSTALSLKHSRGQKSKKHGLRHRHHHMAVSYVMTIEPEALLNIASKKWKEELSKGFDYEESNLPTQTIHSTYVCGRSANGEWSVTKAVDLPESSPIVLCSDDTDCNGFKFGKANSQKGLERIKETKIVGDWSA